MPCSHGRLILEHNLLGQLRSCRQHCDGQRLQIPSFIFFLLFISSTIFWTKPSTSLLPYCLFQPLEKTLSIESKHFNVFSSCPMLLSSAEETYTTLYWHHWKFIFPALRVPRLPGKPIRPALTHAPILHVSEFKLPTLSANPLPHSYPVSTNTLISRKHSDDRQLCRNSPRWSA